MVSFPRGPDGRLIKRKADAPSRPNHRFDGAMLIVLAAALAAILAGLAVTFGEHMVWP